MSLTLVLLTAERLGEQLRQQGLAQLGLPPETPLHAISLNFEANLEVLRPYIKTRLQRLLQPAGMLILTDGPDSTPHQVALSLRQEWPCRVVSGVNLPMLLAVLAARDTQSLDQLAQTAVNCGLAAIRVQ